MSGECGNYKSYEKLSDIYLYIKKDCSKAVKCLEYAAQLGSNSASEYLPDMCIELADKWINKENNYGSDLNNFNSNLYKRIYHQTIVKCLETAGEITKDPKYYLKAGEMYEGTFTDDYKLDKIPSKVVENYKKAFDLGAKDKAGEELGAIYCYGYYAQRDLKKANII